MKLNTIDLYLSLALLNFATVANSFKILSIFLTPFYSHFILVIPILEELLNRGHQLVVISPYEFNVSSQSTENIEVIQLEELQPLGMQFTNQMDFSSGSHRGQTLKHFKLFTEMSEIQLKVLRDKAWDIITQRNYDAIFVEDMGGSYFYKLADFLNASYIGFSPQDQAGETALGNGLHLILHPINDESATVFGFDGAKYFTQRLLCLFSAIHSTIEYFSYNSKARRSIDRSFYGEDPHEWDSDRTRPDLQIKAVHPALGYHRPMLSNSIQIGFPHIKAVTELPKGLRAILNSATSGVIYVSFGSIISSETAGTPGVFDMKTFKRVLSRLPYDIIWKWDTSEMEDRPSNVHLVKWVPQQDLIAHEKVKLVICHGGLQTIAEAIHFEKPLLTFPFIWDHHPNSQRVERLGIGKMFNRDNMDEQELVSAATDLITNESYKVALHDLNSAITDTMYSPVDTAVLNIESTIQLCKDGYKAPFRTSSSIRGLEAAHLEILLSLLAPIFVFLVVMITTLIGFSFSSRHHKSLRQLNKDRESFLP